MPMKVSVMSLEMLNIQNPQLPSRAGQVKISHLPSYNNYKIHNVPHISKIASSVQYQTKC